MELNETDQKILKNLLEDARFSSRQIAKNVGVSVGTVLSRIKKMEEDGLIKGYSVILDHEKLGFQLTVVTEITVSKGRLVETENEIYQIKQFDYDTKVWSHHHNPRTVANNPAGEVTLNLGITGPHYTLGAACAARRRGS